MDEYVWLPLLVAFLIAAIGWLFRELHFRRERRGEAAHDSGEILSKQKTLLEDIISKTEDAKHKEELSTQLEEVNAALLGLYSKRLRHTLEEAGLPTEDALIADGQSRLNPQEVAQLGKVIEEVNALPLFLSAQDLSMLGNAYYYSQQYQDAQNIYDMLLKLNPDDPAALNNKGIICDEQGRYKEALANYSRSLELRPDDHNTLTNRGVAYAKLGRFEQAFADFNRSLELKPDFADAYINQGNTYRLLERYNEALADYNRALEIRPDNPVAIMSRGAAYTDLGRYDEALPDFNRSLELRADNPKTLHNRGMAYAKLERYHEALADFNRSLELRPDDPGTLYDLACLFSLWGKTGEALAYLEKAINKDEKYREDAKTDKDFDNIRDNPRFKKLIESD